MEAEPEFERVLSFLGSIPILQQLPASSVKRLAEAVKFKYFGTGDYIVREGEAGEGIYFIWKGEVEVPPAEDADVAGLTMPSLKAGDYFGYASTGPVKEIHKADVLASTEVICLVLSHEHADLLSTNSIWCSEKDEGIAMVEKILHLESLEVDVFRAFTVPLSPSAGHVFGGQLLGQALAAASKSVDPSLLVHSLHSYFLRTGDVSLPLIYGVQRIRDGHSFAIRHVTAIQKGHTIFTMSASFQRAEQGFEHQKAMPLAPNPEKLLTREQLRESYRTDPRIPVSYRNKLLKNKVVLGPIDIRLCEPEDRVKPTAKEPRQKMWLRARGKLSDDQALHRCVAAYASDFQFIDTSLRPHRETAGFSTVTLSLDHAMWFHKAFRADEWLLFVVESPCASGARGLVQGQMYTQNGELVMSVAQEGVIRRFDKAKVKTKSNL